MNKIIALTILTLFLVAGCSSEPIVGGDKDEHGCIGSAGYQWCSTTQKCQRFWEEPCPSEEEICNVDEDCIPLPSECHPMTCINKKFESKYERPQVCTMIYMINAAYNPEDCICIEGLCVNKNKDKGREEFEAQFNE